MTATTHAQGTSVAATVGYLDRLYGPDGYELDDIHVVAIVTTGSWLVTADLFRDKWRYRVSALWHSTTGLVSVEVLDAVGDDPFKGLC